MKIEEAIRMLTDDAAESLRVVAELVEALEEVRELSATGKPVSGAVVRFLVKHDKSKPQNMRGTYTS